MKTMAAVILAMFTVMTAEAGPQSARGHIHHDPAFRSRSSATHFIARSGNDFHRRFHYGMEVSLFSIRRIMTVTTVYQTMITFIRGR